MDTKKLLCKGLITFVLVVLVVPSTLIPSNYAKAGLLDDLGTISGVAAECTLTDFLYDQASDLIDSLGDRFNDFFGGLTGGDGGIDIPLPNIPGLGEDAVPTHTKEDDRALKEIKKNSAANCLKKALLEALANAIIRSIVEDSGFVGNFRDELLSAADRAAGRVLTDVTRRDICEPFSASLNILVSYDRDYLRDLDRRRRGECTLSEAIENVQDFYEDFRNGGWDVWVKHMETNNTLLGAWIEVDDEIIAAVSAEVDGKNAELSASQGVNPKKVCIEATFRFQDQEPITKPIPETKVGSTEWNALITKVGAIDAICEDERIITPGSVLEEQINKAAGTQIDDFTGADTYYEIVKNLINFIVGRLIDEGLDRIRR